MDEEDSDEFDLRPPSPDLFEGPLPDFEILELIGSGGMGKVYKAKQPNLDRIVALKVLSVAAFDHEDYRFSERFQREATALARLRHPNIVSFYHYGETEEGQIYYMMEYIEGAELSSYIQSRDAEPRHLLYWAIQICAALQFAHENGIVHRDIKPSNLLIDGNGNIKIADFGLAKFSQIEGAEPKTQLTRTDVVVGTPSFIAPELIEDPSAVSPSCDIYSIGVTLYQALTGVIPRGMPSAPSQLVADLDPRWDGILFRCLSSSPEERFSSAAELQESFEELLDSSDLVPVSSLRLRPSRARENSPTKKRANRAVILGGVGSIGALLMAALGFFLWKQAEDTEAGREGVLTILEDSRTIPPSTPLRLSLPKLPATKGELGILSLNQPEEGSHRLEMMSGPDAPVRIWEHPESGGVLGLREDGSVWSLRAEEPASTREWTGLVWLAPAGDFVGALRMDGSVFAWNEEGEGDPIDGEKAFVMMIAKEPGKMILLDQGGGLHSWEPGKSLLTTVPKSIDEECVAMGADRNLFAAVSRAGLLRVWRERSGVETEYDLVFERRVGDGIRREDPDPSVYPDRWIPLFRWGVIGPKGEIFAFDEEDDGVALLPQLEEIEPGTFRFADSPRGENLLRSKDGWQFMGNWRKARRETLERFSEGARRLGLAEDTAVALFSQGLEVAARFEEKESEPIEPEVAPAESKPVEQVWTGKRAEIRATGKNWEESMVQSLLEAIDSELARMEPTLAQWGARNLPGKLVITEVKDQSDEARQHAKLVRLEEGELNALLKAIQEGRPVADRLEFLPPESVFRPLAGKLDPTGESVAFFGDATAHIAEFFRLYTMEDSRVRMEQWERAKVYLSDRIADPGFEVGTAMLDASAGSKFFSGLLGRLHDDYGGNSFLERFFGDELIKQPEPEGPEEAVDLFVVAASLAAGENLLPLFKEELRWPLTSNATDQLREFFPPEDASDEMRTEFRPAPDALLGAWDENYRTEIFPSSLEHRNRLAELRSQYREALSRKGSEHEKAGRAAAAKIYKEEQDRVGPGYEGPVAFNPTLHKALEPEAQAAVRELYAALGRTYRERLRSISTEANSSARGKLTRALDELYRLQHLFTLEGKDEAARWAYDRRRREVGIFSLGSVYSPKFSLDFELKYEEMIRWAVEEEAAVDVVQPITPTSVQRYTVRSIADVQAGRFVWQRLKILGIQRGAVAKPWSDIHLELVSHFEDLERLECGCEELRASTLRAIAGLEELESLSLSGLKVSAKEAAGLAALGNRELKKLNLTGATLPEGALSTLAVGMIARSLEELSLANTNVIDIMPLADFRELERLDITGCEVPQENIEEFTRKMQDCLVVR